MTDDEFAERLAAMRETMYRVSYAQLARACDRDDAVQETLLKAWGKRRKLGDERVMQTWVIRILINECHNIQRKQRRETLPGVLPERAAPADADAELHDALFRLEESLRQLKARYGYCPVGRVVEMEPWSRVPERRLALIDFDL